MQDKHKKVRNETSQFDQDEVLYEKFRALGLFNANSHKKIEAKVENTELKDEAETRMKNELLQQILNFKDKIKNSINQENNLLSMEKIKDEKISHLELAIKNLKTINYDTIRENAVKIIEIANKKNYTNYFSEKKESRHHKTNSMFINNYDTNLNFFGVNNYNTNHNFPISKISESSIKDRNLKIKSLDINEKTLSCVN